MRKATVLAGAQATPKTYNDTYRGPIRTEGGDVRLAFIKDLDARQLCCEMLANDLAKSLGLPTPDAFLARANPSDLPLRHAPTISNGDHIVFASSDVNSSSVALLVKNAASSSLQRNYIDVIRTFEDIGSVYAFDSWIANIDRHAGNILINGNNDIWLIDHGHAMGGPPWDFENLDPSSAYNNRLREWLTQFLEHREKSKAHRKIKEFPNKASSICVESLDSTLFIERIIGAAEMRSIANFLVDRVQYVTRQASAAAGTPLVV